MFTSRSFRWMALFIALAAGIYFYTSLHYPIVNTPPRRGPIVAFGDSLTSGYGATLETAYPAQLAKLIGRPVINAGVAGDTIEQATRRLPRDVLRYKPGIVIVLLGGNDILLRRDLDASFAELERTIRRIQGSGAMVVLAGLQVVTPVGGVKGRYASLARRTGCVYIPNILHEIFFDHALMADKTHPNAKGYGVMAKRIEKVLRPYL